MVLYYYHPYVSGLSVMAKRIAEGLAKQGYEVTVLTSWYDKSLPRREVIQGVTIVRQHVWFRLGKGVIMPTLIPDIIRFARHSDYLNVYLPLAESGIAALLVPKRKIVTTYVCDIYLGHKPYERFVTFMAMCLMHLQLLRSRVVVALSRDYLEHSKMRHYVSKAVPIYPPVLTDEFLTVNPKPLFDPLGIRDDEAKIGFVGRIVYEKGIGYLLGAVPYLESELRDFRVIIVGEYEKLAGGSTKDELDSYITRYPGRILFTGYLNDEDRNRFYSGVDVLVLPSIDPLEAFGMVQVEAMLYGTPVVASNLPGVREVVQKTGYGRISQVRDSADIARQIIEIIEDPSSYKPERGKVQQIFDPQASIDGYAKLMPKVAD